MQKKIKVIDAKEIFTASLVLFAVIDIVGNIPLVISLREKVGHIQSEKASIIAAIIMIGFLFVGEEILTLLELILIHLQLQDPSLFFF